MATAFSFNVRDEIAAEVETALAARYGWTENIVNEAGETVANPMNKAQAARRRLKDLAKNDLVEERNRQALSSVVAEGEL